MHQRYLDHLIVSHLQVDHPVELIVVQSAYKLVTEWEAWMHQFSVEGLLAFFSHLIEPVDLGRVYQRCLDHLGVGTAQHCRVDLILVLRCLSSQEVETLGVNEDTATVLEGAVELGTLETVCAEVQLIHEFPRNEDRVVFSIEEDRVFAEAFADVQPRVVNRVVLNKVALVISVEREVSLVNNTKHLSRSGSAVNADHDVALLKFEGT